MGLAIPRDFGKRVAAGQTATVQVLLDGSDSNTASIALGYVDGQDFRHVVQAGAQHNEVYWAERFLTVMQLLLGARA